MNRLINFQALTESFELDKKAFSKGIMSTTIVTEIISKKGAINIRYEYMKPIEYLNYCARKIGLSTQSIINLAKKENENATWKIYLYANVMLHLAYPKVEDYNDAIKLCLTKIKNARKLDIRKAFPPPAFATTIKKGNKQEEYFIDGKLRALAAIVAGVEIIPVLFFRLDENKNGNHNNLKL